VIDTSTSVERAAGAVTGDLRRGCGRFLRSTSCFKPASSSSLDITAPSPRAVSRNCWVSSSQSRWLVETRSRSRRGSIVWLWPQGWHQRGRDQDRCKCRSGDRRPRGTHGINQQHSPASSRLRSCQRYDGQRSEPAQRGHRRLQFALRLQPQSTRPAHQTRHRRRARRSTRQPLCPPPEQPQRYRRGVRSWT